MTGFKGEGALGSASEPRGLTDVQAKATVHALMRILKKVILSLLLCLVVPFPLGIIIPCLAVPSLI
jgi:hypothetical protein